MRRNYCQYPNCRSKAKPKKSLFCKTHWGYVQTLTLTRLATVLDRMGA